MLTKNGVDVDDNNTDKDVIYANLVASKNQSDQLLLTYPKCKRKMRNMSFDKTHQTCTKRAKTKFKQLMSHIK